MTKGARLPQVDASHPQKGRQAWRQGLLDPKDSASGGLTKAKVGGNPGRLF